MSQNSFSSRLIRKHPKNKARIIEVSTPHGTFLSPVFMPVGTRAAVNHMTPEDLRATQSQIILGGNTYHMLVTPGMEVIEAAGGMHSFMNWSGPMLIDSGGFQVFSLSKNSKICKIDEEGGHFRHPHHGQLIHLTPESSITTQKILGADIIMAFDQCTPDTDDRRIVELALDRTDRWLDQSLALHRADPLSRYGQYQAFFGIVQGAHFRDLRERSARYIVSRETDGIAIGGESIGFAMDKTIEILDWITPILPEEKPRYTMGVGLHPRDLIAVVEAGVDMFDCVAPTRNARHGSLYCGRILPTEDEWVRWENAEGTNGTINIEKACFALDQ